MMGGVAFGLKIEEQPLRKVVFVFDHGDQRSRRFGHGLSGDCPRDSARGNVNVMVVPSPGPELDAVTSPPCWRAMLRTRKRPSPVPLILTIRAPGHAIEPPEDALQLIRRHAHARIGDPQRHPRIARDGQRAANLHPFGRILDRIVEHVERAVRRSSGMPSTCSRTAPGTGSSTMLSGGRW